MALTPHMAMAMGPFTTTEAGFATHMEQILVTRFTTHIGSQPHQSWLGHFTLAVHLFGDLDRFQWTLVPDAFVVQLIKTTVDNPNWWWRPRTQAPDWTWAAVVVRLLGAFPQCPNRWVCMQAAGAVARYLGDTLDARTVTADNWTTKVPIFPRPHDLGRVLSLMRDEDITDPGLFPVLARAITDPGAILNRLSTVWQWTVAAITQLIHLADANTVATLAWASWFESPMRRMAQCAAVRVATERNGTPPLWVTLLRIHALIPTDGAPPPCAAHHPLVRLVSNQAGAADVHQALLDYVVRPTPEVRAQMEHWAHNCSLHNKPAPFVLQQLRRYCAQFVQPPDAAMAHSEAGFGGIVGQTLLEWASGENAPDACDALWFVVHYAADDVLIATAARWVTDKFCHRLRALQFFDGDMLTEIVSCLNARCALLDPRNQIVESLCMGLDVMATRGVREEKFTYDDMLMFKTMLDLLGGADHCHFMYNKLMTCQRWATWATLVMSDSAAWQRFVRGSPDGHRAAQCVFRQFPTMPPYPEQVAWQDTHTAVGVFYNACGL